LEELLQHPLPQQQKNYNHKISAKPTKQKAARVFALAAFCDYTRFWVWWRWKLCGIGLLNISDNQILSYESMMQFYFYETWRSL
jgi:succinate-acetate transporter protein